MKKIKIQRGFSLIELMVVIAIIAITAGILLFSYSDDRTRKELEASANEFAGTVREAQNYALTGKQLVPSTTPCAYQVVATSASRSYSLVYYYKAVGNSKCNVLDITQNTSAVIYTKTLRRTSYFASEGAFHFLLPHASPSYGSLMPIILDNNGILSHTVCLYGEGRITTLPGSSCPST